MSRPNRASSRFKQGCLTIDDLYHYIAIPSPGEGSRDLDAHLADCPRCREELAEVLRLLHPEAGDPAGAPPPPSQKEIAQTVALIQGVAQKEAVARARPAWLRWAAAAAAAVVLVIVAAAGYRYSQVRISNQYLALAKADLAGVYAARSPNGLRLDLPFGSAAASRAAVDDSALKSAEIHFSQALAGRETAKEPHLGLAAIYLSGSHFARARDQFQRVLDLQQGHLQALIGRGVAEYEMAKQEIDPITRQDLFSQSLADFDSALKQQPGCAEARYNRIWVLYETGRHQEALAEIGNYLARDPNSIWAARLRELQTQIRLVNDEAVDTEVNRAARSRDAAILASIARLVHEKAPAAIRSALKEGLQREAAPAKPDEPGPADLQWAAETLEAAYSAATGDQSWNALIRFYVGLSPPQRKLKRELDKKLFELAEFRGAKPYDAALLGSETLEPQYSFLKDTWQLFNIHSLRGYCFFWQADFKRAEAEYRLMLQYAESTGAPEMRAKALAALSSTLGELAQLDDMADCIAELNRVAERYRLDLWNAYAASSAGTLHRKLHQPQECLKDYSAVLGFAYRNQDESKLVEALQALVPVMSEMGRPQDVASLCSQGLEAVRSLQKSAGGTRRTEVEARLLNMLYGQGQAAFEAGSLDLAESCFLAGLRGSLEKMSELEGRLRLGLAQVYLQKKRFPDAEPLLEKSGLLADAGKFEELEWQTGFLKGEMHKELGDAALALSDFTRCIDTLERMRSRISSEDLRRQFLNRRFDPYKEIVSLLCDPLHNDRRAAEFASRAKSMTLREYLGDLKSDTAGEVNEIARTLGAWCIDYFFAANDLLAFVSGPDRVQAVALQSSRAEIERTIKEYLDSIRTGNERNFDVCSRQLYDKIVAPVFRAAGMEQCERLVIFPDGPLYLLPFGGLKDTRGRHLLETCVISYAPAPSVLRHCMSLQRGSAAGASRTVLLLDGTANLPAAGNELARISKLYPGSRFLNARNLSAAPGLSADAEIIHFAGHATLKDGKPTLMLQGPPHPVLLDSGKITSWRLRKSRLVTLAGCETGVGPQAEGEIPWSLIPAFLNAGSPALLVSLLPVDDAATGAITAHFYELLAANRTIAKAAALRQAQLSLLTAARASGRASPASWLPFILVGDPR